MDNKSHFVRLEDRNKLEIFGVSEVLSFDDLSVVLDTLRGRLIINGGELHIQTLCLEDGRVLIDGNIDELLYEDGTPNKKRSFFGRLLK